MLPRHDSMRMLAFRLLRVAITTLHCCYSGSAFVVLRPEFGSSVLKTSTTLSGHYIAPSHLNDFHRRPLGRRSFVGSSLGSAQNDDETDNSKNNDDEDYTGSSNNPFQDPNYPDLEFINYADPEYQADQGQMFGDELFPIPPSPDDDNQLSREEVEAEIERMREERRRRNDEYQFQTYFSRTYRNGTTFVGDWTIYQTSTFLPPNNDHGVTVDRTAVPQLVQARSPVLATSKAVKQTLSPDGVDHNTGENSDNERIFHQEKFLDARDEKRFVLSNYYKPYWPEELRPFDFRGQQGIMVCGDAWTICTAKPLIQTTANPAVAATLDSELPLGPFSEYRTEVGIQYDAMRFRVKLDYCTHPEDDHQDSATPPPLYLKHMTVCREVAVPDVVAASAVADGSKSSLSVRSLLADAAPDMTDALFGVAGAEGGLYDPPPIGDDEHQVSQYILLDLPGRATALLPYKMDQDEKSFSGPFNWVMSLDWTPGEMRYQVDRKVPGGAGMLGLRSLELSEVRSADAETYRPRDGGADMRQ